MFAEGFIVTDLAGRKVAYYGFSGPIDSNSCTRIATALNAAVNSQCDTVHLNISSIGGLIADGIYLYNHIRSLPLDVTMHNTGSIASIATAVFVAAGKRTCSAHSVFMIHPSAIPLQESMGAERLQSFVDSALAEDERTENILRERTSLPKRLLTARRLKNVHISPQKALEFGLVHAIDEFVLPRGHEIFQI